MSEKLFDKLNVTPVLVVNDKGWFYWVFQNEKTNQFNV